MIHCCAWGSSGNTDATHRLAAALDAHEMLNFAQYSMAMFYDVCVTASEISMGLVAGFPGSSNADAWRYEGRPGGGKQSRIYCSASHWRITVYASACLLFLHQNRYMFEKVSGFSSSNWCHSRSDVRFVSCGLCLRKAVRAPCSRISKPRNSNSSSVSASSSCCSVKRCSCT